MADNFVEGNGLEIPKGLLKKLENIDNNINKIAEDSEKMGTNFSEAIVGMDTGADGLLKKLSDISKIIKDLGKGDSIGKDGIGKRFKSVSYEAEGVARSVNKAVVAMNQMGKVSNPNSSVMAWQGLQKNIDSLFEKQEKLLKITKEYEDSLKILKRAGKAGLIPSSDQKKYKEAVEELDANRKLIDTYRKKQQAIIAYQNEQRKQIQNERELKDLAINDSSLGSRKKNEELEKLNDRFRVLEKEWNERAKRQKKLAEETARAEERKSERIRRANEREAKSREKLREAQERRANNKAEDAYNRAMAASEGTITQRINKLAKLRQAEEMLLKTGRDYSANLKKIKTETERLNTANQQQIKNQDKVAKSQKHLMDISGQLARKLALIFSVSQVQGYLMNVVRVTGEFEKQNVALASILQNKNQADKLFGQITELAVKSPFQLKELVTYTKSLSAYQVEYEKLFDTTKMLADVSAGLGVDMQRLILAFGQVKAANFLRGTEVRQFTEAGLNILGELAKYYSELEGRMVSVGEVQEMVTKRMVSFGDVEEVFKRVTSAGGVFYNMQERQAETLAGQMSNLSDSIDIMLNDIGSANNDTIKEAIGSVRELLQNWRDLAYAFKVAALELSPFLAYLVLARASSTKLGMAISAMGKNMLISAGIMKSAGVEAETFSIKAKLATFWTKAWKTALKGIATLGVGAAIGAIVIGIEKVIVEMTRASRQSDELNSKLSSILGGGEYEAAKLSNGFRHLAETVLDSSTSIDKQKEALDELQRTYKDIIPSVDLTVQGLQKMKGNYDSVTRAIYDKIEAQVKEKQINAVSETYGRDVEVAFDKVKETLQREQKMFPEDAAKVVTALRQALEDGTLKIGDDYTKFAEDYIKENYKLNSKLRTAFREIAVTTSGGATTFMKVQDVNLQNTAIERLAVSVFKLREEIDKITGVKLESLGGSSSYRALQEDLEKRQELIRNARKKIAEENKGKNEFFISEEQNKAEKKIIREWIEEFKNGSTKIRDAYNNLIDPKSSTSLKFIEELQDKINGIDGNPAQIEIKNIIRSFAKLNDISLVKMNRVLMTSSQSMSDYRKQVEGDIKSIEERIEQYNKGYSGFITNIFNEKDLEKEEQTLKLLKAIRLAAFPKYKSESGESSQIKKLKEQIALIKKAGEEYKKLRKYYSTEESENFIKSSFGDAFKSLGLSIDMEFDEEGVYNGIKKLSKSAGEEGKKAVNKALAEIDSKKTIKVGAEGLEKIKKDIEDIFTNYEFSVELKSSGIDVTEFKNMLETLGADNEMITSIGLDDDTFEETIKALEEKKKELEIQGGEDQYKEAEKIQKKITSMILNEAKSRLGELQTLREKYLSKEEKAEKISVDIQEWENDLKAIKELGEESNKEQIELLELRIQNGKDAIVQLKSEALQLTDFWQRVFGELGDLSVKSLQKIMDINQQIFDSATEIKGKDGNTIGYNASYIDDKGLKKNVTLTISQYQRLIKQNNKVSDEIQKKNPFISLWDAIKKGKEEGETTLDFMERIGGSIKGVSDVSFEAANNIADIFAANEDVKQTIQDVQNITNGAIDAGMGIGKIAAGDIVGGSLQALSGISKVFTTLFSMGDKRKEKEIKRQLELVERLKESYERLQEAIDAAFDVQSLNKLNKELEKNLRERNKALQKSINKEEDKKKTDHGRIQEWEKEIEENNRKIIENNKKLLESMGGFGTDDRIKSAAEEFASAWLDAYLEVGNGLDGLQNKMTDWLKSAVQKQLLVNLSKEFITPVLKQFDEMFKEGSLGGTKMMPEEAAAWKELYETKSKEFDEAAKAYLEALKAAGIDLTDKKEGDSLVGLQKGISSISEATAEALESITESIRFFTADSNMQLKTIVNILVNPPLENPFINELRLQTEQMRVMNSLWSSLTMTKSGVSGKVLKVQIF